MLIDLHTHTKVHSPCSALTVEALVRAGRARGLDGVCLTEHDALWALGDVQRVAAEMMFVVLRGMEVTTEAGHVLVFGLERHDPAMASLARLHRLVRAEGGLMYLAHPSRRYGALPPAEELATLFDSVEVENGTEGVLQNENAAALTRGMRLPGIGGSDCHSAREVGVCATEFSAAVRDEGSFVAALRAGEYRARRV
ncbi:MAG TPA: CehA/McbA family metallohydrolase [Dehalococcoidia bacterium]|nr:CehA/McbA family metallohydrolase [Dehalococcoidia bacterium]